MIRKTLGKVFPVYTILPLCLTAVSMLCSYQAAKLFQLIFGFSDPFDLTLSFDAQTPFVPGWIWLYVGSYIFWCYIYIIAAKDSAETACKLAVADFRGKMIALVFFLAVPTTNERPTVEGSGITAFLMRFIYFMDTPTNLFPSIHCFVAWLGTRYVFTTKHLKHKWLHCIVSIIGTFLVFGSTLYTKQHVLLDVLGGIAIGEIGFLVAHFSPLSTYLKHRNDKFPETKVGKFLVGFVTPAYK